MQNYESSLISDLKNRLTAKLWSLVAVVQTVIVSVTFPALLDTAVVLTGKLPWLTLWRRDVRRVRCVTQN